ncbi:MAG: tetratricopeptide repeat protein [Candidatus Omnitrophica bacterium]|nr:tetratricopeptide repeat protein [Candidatus Omnitrophota bacterium]MCB9722295.1 tetratricopeptide repeat protein [Candidatus Omnitrophota bacterium]
MWGKVTITMGILLGGMLLAAPPVASQEDLATQSSASLTINAWKALNNEDFEEAITYADACITRFGDRAARMQAKLDDYPTGPDHVIHQYYALNDVATAHYIKGQALTALERLDEAEAAYQDLVDKYAFGQCWDPRGWFRKPAVVAKEKLHQLKTGEFLDFGDYSSMTLMVLAWKALDEGDIEAVLAYSNKCIELYAEEAAKMQAGLKEIPAGEDDEIHAYWALNDVATAYFIQGEAYFKSDMLDEAKQAYRKVMDEYPYAQCWDPRGWFWKVAAGAEEKVAMIDSGLFMNFWDYSSKDLVGKAWKSLESGDLARAVGYATKCIEMYEDDARRMQSELDDYPQGTEDEIHAYWALNDVATAHYIKGQALQEQNKPREARREYQAIVDRYSFAQCWDPRGWWWKPVTEARHKLDAMAPAE